MHRLPDPPPPATVLRRSATAAIGAAVVVSLLVPVVWTVVVALSGGDVGERQAGITDVISGVAVACIYALLFGATPLLLLGLPLYAFAAHRRRNSWIVAVSIGVLPGALLLLAQLLDDTYRVLGGFFLLYGVLTAMLTHLCYTRCVFLGDHRVTASFSLRRARSASPSAPAPSPPPPAGPSA